VIVAVVVAAPMVMVIVVPVARVRLRRSRQALAARPVGERERRARTPLTDAAFSPIAYAVGEDAL